jgi:hypothetical protein
MLQQAKKEIFQNTASPESFEAFTAVMCQVEVF